MGIDFKWSDDPKTDDEISTIMQNSLNAVREAAPDLPVLVIVAFPPQDVDDLLICAGSNVRPCEQELLLTLALEGVQKPPPNTTLN